jgi:outer membrane protein assembly factor BamB
MALNAGTGELVWSRDKPPQGFKSNYRSYSTGTDYSTPVLLEHTGTLYALVSSWKGITAVDTQSGRPSWLYEWEFYSGRHVTEPIVLGDRVLITDNYAAVPEKASLLLEVTGSQPAVVWRSAELYTEINTPVVVGGYVFGGQGGPHNYRASLRCIELETGHLRWEQVMSDASLRKCVSLMAADDKLIILTDDGILSIAEANSDGYRKLSRCTVRTGESSGVKYWTPPVLSGGRIYCREYGGDLVCIDVRK